MTTRRDRQAGFTLIEIMVGLVIGMLATMVILQVFGVFEAQKRTTTGTADAQTNGNIALYNLSRELQQVGYPLAPYNDTPLDCTTLRLDQDVITVSPNASALAPVTLTDGVSDTVTLHYGNSMMGGIPTPITAVGALNPDEVTVDNNLGCGNNDVALLMNGNTCYMTTASPVSGVTTTLTLADATDSVVVNDASIACLGNWREIAYAVNNGVLERSETPVVTSGAAAIVAAPAQPVVDGIVNIQAQYGVSAGANDNQVALWVDPAGADWANPTVADRNRIKAIRIAVVARNAKAEPGNVTSACSSLTAANPTGLCAWAGSADSPAPAIDLSADADWRKYRYRVFETVLPLRNVIWSKDML